MNPLWSDAEQIFRAGVDAVSPSALIQRAISRAGDTLQFEESGVAVKLNHNVKVFGFGKAVLGMCAAVDNMLHDHIVEGIISVPLDSVETMRALRPEFLLRSESVIRTMEGAADNIPDEAASEAGREILRGIKNATADDLIILLISGGGSALLPVPVHEVSLEDLKTATKVLAKKGATINELNTVRKHLSRVKGGRLAEAALPAQLHTFILSDVIGDPLDIIASGPTVPDPSTFADCIAIVDRLNVGGDLPLAVTEHLRNGTTGKIDETPNQEHSCFATVHNTLVGTNQISLNACKTTAEGLGYTVVELGVNLEGHARDAAIMLVDRLNTLRKENVGKTICLLGGGETTCIVRGNGRGGRNQELALVAALEMKAKGIDMNAVLLSAGTDGQDGPTDAAGAFGCPSLSERCLNLEVDPTEYLENNDSYNLFKHVGGLLKTGLTGTNVMDLVVGLVKC